MVAVDVAWKFIVVQSSPTRALVKESRDRAVGDSGTLAEATDLSIMHTGSRIVDGLGGRGLNIQAGASFEGLRLKLQSNPETGLFVSDASATLSDVSIINTLPQEEGQMARGIQISDGAVVGLERVLCVRIEIERIYRKWVQYDGELS